LATDIPRDLQQSSRSRRGTKACESWKWLGSLRTVKDWPGLQSSCGRLVSSIQYPS
jgi:hypothetical protein